MTRETRRLLAKLHLGPASPQDFADFAMSLLEAGHDTPHLRMLASLGHTAYRADYDYYFTQTMTELGWTIPPADQLVENYALDIAQDIADGTLAPAKGCKLLYRLHVALLQNYENFYLDAWFELDHQFDPKTGEDLTDGERWEQAIRHEARKMLQKQP